MENGPVAIGGIGGSGTRIIAQILSDMGFFLGADINLPYDNLWFAFLFGRRDILLTDEDEFARLAELFFRQMSRPQELNESELALLRDRLVPDRIQHNSEFLQQWYESFVAHGYNGKPQANWGWKMPYTHVIVDRLLTLRSDLKYIHMTRDGLDMAFCQNQNQLITWGPIYLNRNVTRSPVDALSFWCAVHRRVTRLSHRFPDRVYNIDFGQLVETPNLVLSGLLSFLGIKQDDNLIDRLGSVIKKPDSMGRHRNNDMSALLPQDIEYFRSVG